MAFTFKVKKRCRFCGKVLREDGTCKNPDCPRYVPDPAPTVEPTPETPSTGEPVQSGGESATNTNDGGNTETTTP